MSSYISLFFIFLYFLVIFPCSLSSYISLFFPFLCSFLIDLSLIPGEQIYEQLKEKEEKRKPKPNKQKPRRESNESTMTNTGKDVDQAPKKRVKKGKHHVETELPKLHVPKKRVRKPKTVELTSNNISEELADPEFTCPICNIQGHTSDEESGIFWVGCDNARCSRWYHRECLTHDQHADVDLSLLTGGTWHCHLCQNDGILHSEDMSCTTHEVLCQVCMLSCTAIEIRDGIDLFWINCKCGKSYHKSCLPSYVYREWDLAKEAWRCGHCPDQNLI
ncbi:uncharacterized protein LOC117337430 [Pecten maximus]|uniref:uncharacterized protein LOC117337430 n=1 Tax=Pecten maximus TaxID=6579 RepID=UPI0014587D46|nr:uncharacterized protein LOC117337430 [Pecten maximus]